MTLPGGTILTSFEDPPLSEAELDAAIELPAELEEDFIQTWRANKRLHPAEGPVRWAAGTLPRSL
jgi:hypothetical protein